MAKTEGIQLYASLSTIFNLSVVSGCFLIIYPSRCGSKLSAQFYMYSAAIPKFHVPDTPPSHIILALGQPTFKSESQMRLAVRKVFNVFGMSYNLLHPKRNNKENIVLMLLLRCCLDHLPPPCCVLEQDTLLPKSTG